MASNRKVHRIRVKMKDNVAEVKLLISHPMENGRRKDKASGAMIPRHFIRELNCEHNGEVVLTAHLSWGVARNPYISFGIIDAKPGDAVLVSWIDNQGMEESVAANVG